MVELGEFEYLCPIREKEEEFLFAVAYGVSQFLLQFKKGRKRILTFFTLNGRPASIFFKKMLETYPIPYELVRTFTNINSGRKLETYIQNI